jgi:hypothetical protein
VFSFHPRQRGDPQHSQARQEERDRECPACQLGRADEAASWNPLHGRYEFVRIDHSKAHRLDGISSNQAESFFSRLRRGERGHFHHISCPYVENYARESAWQKSIYYQLSS